MSRVYAIFKLGIGIVIVLAMIVIGYRLGSGVSVRGGTISVSDAEVCLRRGSTIYFTAIFGTEEYLKKLGVWEEAERRSRLAQAFILNVTTHVGTIQDLKLDGKVFLVADGIRYPSIGRVQGLTTHHNTYLVFFPRYDMQGKPLFEKGSGMFDIVVELGEEVDPILPQRVLTFHYPLPGAGVVHSHFTKTLMLIGAALAALLIACTPCLVGSLMTGSLTMGVAGGLSWRRAWQQVRSEMVCKTLYYLAALILAYLAVAMVVNIYKLQTKSLRPVEMVGGVLLLLIGLNFLRSWRPVAWMENRLLNFILPFFSKFAPLASLRTRIRDFEFGSGASSAMGASWQWSAR